MRLSSRWRVRRAAAAPAVLGMFLAPASPFSAHHLHRYRLTLMEPYLKLVADWPCS